MIGEGTAAHRGGVSALPKDGIDRMLRYGMGWPGCLREALADCPSDPDAVGPQHLLHKSFLPLCCLLLQLRVGVSL
jgi:hypothetical protein